MAKQVVNIVTCDRCKHTTKNPVDASNLDAVASGLVSFEDLCTKCERRVIALTDEIRAPKTQAPKADDGSEE